MRDKSKKTVDPAAASTLKSFAATARGAAFGELGGSLLGGLTGLTLRGGRPLGAVIGAHVGSRVGHHAGAYLAARKNFRNADGSAIRLNPLTAGITSEAVRAMMRRVPLLNEVAPIYATATQYTAQANKKKKHEKTAAAGLVRAPWPRPATRISHVLNSRVARPGERKHVADMLRAARGVAADTAFSTVGEQVKRELLNNNIAPLIRVKDDIKGFTRRYSSGVRSAAHKIISDKATAAGRPSPAFAPAHPSPGGEHFARAAKEVHDTRAWMHGSRKAERMIGLGAITAAALMARAPKVRRWLKKRRANRKKEAPSVG